MKTKNVLTDNGSQFTDRFTSKTRTPSGRHVFDVACSSIGIEHRLCPPRHPQTKGMVERFNGRIAPTLAPAGTNSVVFQGQAGYGRHLADL